jgi:Cd2+/Zn2+-exporting ATPase
MLPVLGQLSQEPEVREPEAARVEPDCCSDDCCSDVAAEESATTPTTREANPEAPPSSAILDGLERTVVRVEGMDCASCAATVERRVAALPGVAKATVNFAAGRLDAEHDPGLDLTEIEKAVEDAGYGVARAEEAERTLVLAHAEGDLRTRLGVAVLVGLALSLAGVAGEARAGVYVAAIVVGGLPIFRAAVAGLRARHLDMNVLMSAATIGAVGIGEWAEACLGRGPLRRRQRPAGLRH